MIMSLKAASLGPNMVAAYHVLMLDLWWNPTAEDQAIDRAHPSCHYRYVPWQFLLPSHLLFPYDFIPENYVHWIETLDSHIFSNDIPGVRKEEMRERSRTQGTL